MPDPSATPPPPDLARDAGRVDGAALPARPTRGVDGRVAGKFQAVFAPSALDRLRDHGRERTDVEICGVLVGRPCRDDAGPYLHVVDVIRGTAAESRGTQVTFTAATWDAINAELDARRRASGEGRDGSGGEQVVGWYHTHPGFGVFLSGMDLFIHENFFDLPHQAAVVYDPLNGDLGCFLWRGGRAEREPFLVEPAGDDGAEVGSGEGERSERRRGRGRRADDQAGGGGRASGTPDLRSRIADSATGGVGGARPPASGPAAPPPTRLGRLRRTLDLSPPRVAPGRHDGDGPMLRPGESPRSPARRDRRRRALLVTAGVFALAFALAFVATRVLDALAPPPPEVYAPGGAER